MPISLLVSIGEIRGPVPLQKIYGVRQQSFLERNIFKMILLGQCSYQFWCLVSGLRCVPMGFLPCPSMGVMLATVIVLAASYADAACCVVVPHRVHVLLATCVFCGSSLVCSCWHLRARSVWAHAVCAMLPMPQCMRSCGGSLLHHIPLCADAILDCAATLMF